jgi:hypothetical protein
MDRSEGFLDPTLECESPINADVLLAGAVNLDARVV